LIVPPSPLPLRDERDDDDGDDDDDESCMYDDSAAAPRSDVAVGAAVKVPLSTIMADTVRLSPGWDGV
jgi:hypothetical protein